MVLAEQTYWRAYCCVPADLADDIAAECFALGAMGTQLLDEDPMSWSAPTRHGLFLPANLAPTAKHTWVLATFEPSGQEQQILQQQLQAIVQSYAIIPTPLFYFEHMVAPPAELHGQDHCQPHKLTETIWVIPNSAHHFQPPVGSQTIRMEPGMAFGTGQHPTTAMCAQAIVAWCQTIPLLLRPHVRMADIGCGAGILSLVGALTGIGTILATDIDQQALDCTQQNIAKQDITDKTTFILAKVEEQTVLPPSQRHFRADLVVANILANPLEQLAPQLIALCAPAGTLCLSGLLAEQLQAVSQAYQVACQASDRSIAASTIHRRGEWAALVLQLDACRDKGKRN